MTDATAGPRLDGGVLYYGGVAGITHGEAVALRVGTAPRSQWCRNGGHIQQSGKSESA